VEGAAGASARVGRQAARVPRLVCVDSCEVLARPALWALRAWLGVRAMVKREPSVILVTAHASVGLVRVARREVGVDAAHTVIARVVANGVRVAGGVSGRGSGSVEPRDVDEVAARILDAARAHVEREGLVRSLAATDGNLRRVLFDLYDWFEAQASKDPPAAPPPAPPAPR
jgi:hypothetical protein